MQTTTPNILSNGLQDLNRPVVVDFTISELVEALSNQNGIRFKNGSTQFINKNSYPYKNFNFNRPNEVEENAMYQSNGKDNKETEINRGFMHSPPPYITYPTRPITNTFNLLKRKTTKPIPISSGTYLKL